MNKTWLKIGVAILSLQLLLFIIYMASRYLTAEMPLVFWDALGYYLDAKNIFQHSGLEALKSLQNSGRPVFAWFSLALIKITGLSLNYQLLSGINTCFYHVILVASIYYILASTKANILIIITAISTLYSMPIFFNLSATLLGDVAVASWIMLFSACLVAIQKPSHRLLKAFILGAITALGFQTKPIFILYLVSSLICFAVTNISYAILFQKVAYIFSYRFLLVLASFCISFCSLLYLIFPLNLPKLILDLSYNNEVLGYWVTEAGIFNSYLWFPKVFLNEIAILPALILGLSLLGQPIIIMKSFPVLRNIGNIFKALLNIGKFVLHKNLISFIFLSFIILTAYVSLFVKSKDARVLFFLLPMSITLSFCAFDWLSKLSKLNRKFSIFLLVSILVSNFSNVASWSPTILSGSSLQIFNNYLNIANLRLSNRSAEVNNVDTYEKLGIENVLNFIEKDCQPACLTKASVVFIPHGNFRYNDSVFWSFHHIKNNISIDSQAINPTLNFTTSMFNFGGWGAEGGIPKSFFTANYIILVKNNLATGNLAGNTEVYNKTLAEQLSAEKPEFLDGLVPVYETINKRKDKIIVYKRQNLPSANSFVEIVRYLSLRDPNNIWNAPFIYAALQIDPQLSELRQQLQQMSELIKSVKYRYGTPQQEEKIRVLLKDSNDVTKHKDVKYPGFLTKF